MNGNQYDLNHGRAQNNFPRIQGNNLISLLEQRRLLMVLEWMENIFTLAYTYNQRDHKGCSDHIAARFLLEIIVQVDRILCLMHASRLPNNAANRGVINS
jgi:hypothetical protein